MRQHISNRRYIECEAHIAVKETFVSLTYICSVFVLKIMKFQKEFLPQFCRRPHKASLSAGRRDPPLQRLPCVVLTSTKPPLCKGRGTACGGGIVYLMIFALQKSTSIPNCVVTKYALLHFAIRKISPAPLFLLFPTQRTSFCLVSGALLSAFRIAIPAPFTFYLNFILHKSYKSVVQF